MRWNNREMLPALLACVLCVLLSSGCGTHSDAPRDTSVLRLSFGYEPTALDPDKSFDSLDNLYITALFEGLTEMNEAGMPVPAAAESWDISEDQLTYTFYLRPSRWSNGEPVRAQDFVYAWKRLLSPETGNEYAYFLYPVVGAEEFNKGQGGKEQIGIRAVDDRTLEVHLKQVTPYFLTLCANMTLMPVCEKISAQNENWAAQASTFVGNGPFRMESWQHYKDMVLVKNEFYWDKDAVKLSRIESVMVDSSSTRKALFDQGELDFTTSVPLAAFLRYQQEGQTAAEDAVWVNYIECNTRQPPFDDVRVRKALSLALDRDIYEEAILQGTSMSGYALVPTGILNPVTQKDFRAEGGELFHMDIAAARQLLAEAGYPDGKGFPQVTLLYSTDIQRQMHAEVMQQMWLQNLGIQVELQGQEWPVFNQARALGQFQMSYYSYYADYLDPMAFLECWATGNINNCSGYSNPQFDALLEKVKNTTDQAARMQLMHDAEKIAVDDMAGIPLSFDKAKYLVKPYVKGAVLSSTQLYLKYAWIEP